MLSAKIEAALNKQINQEMASAYKYLAMAAYFEQQGLKGFADWMKQQRMEELTHATRLFEYVLDRGGKIDLEAVEKPKAEFASVREVLVQALKQEEANTKGIHELYALAVAAKDYATQMHMQWFVTEQVEEEKTVGDALKLVEIAGDNKSALLVLNDKMAQRQPVVSSGRE